MAWSNEDVAAQLAEIAALLQLTGADRFRIRAYERAASAVATLPTDLAELGADELAAVDGVGGSTAKRILEYREQGRIAVLDELRARVPPGVLDLTRVPGLGPKTAMLVHNELGVTSIDELRSALGDGRLRSLPGLGARTEQRLRDGLERLGAKDDGRRPLADVVALAEELAARLGRLPDVAQAQVAGSVRRLEETVGDVDVLVTADRSDAVTDALVSDDLVTSVLASGPTRTSVVLRRGLQADVRVVPHDGAGAALQYFTGTRSHNVGLRERALRLDLTASEYGVHRRDGGDRVAGRHEEEVYAALGLPWLPPPLRQGQGEVAAAARGELSTVVRVEDLRGDLHGHTSWSGDGTADLQTMAAAAADRGDAYWAVTDHAENLTINGLSREQFRARRRELRAVEERVGIRLLDGVELNIDVDGGLDYDEEFLLEFDFAVASIHHRLDLSGDQQTRRLLRAMTHPVVNVIGHPTGRKLGVRPGYDLDIDVVAEQAAATGTALELNASPRRLDLSAGLARRAVGHGAALTISCDAHSVGDLDGMRYGVAQAQRAWVTPEQVLNCLPLPHLLDRVDAKRDGRRRVRR